MRQTFIKRVLFYVVATCLLVIIATVHFGFEGAPSINGDNICFGADFMSTSSDSSRFRKMVVFDSKDHFGSLQFLNRPATDWSVMVINVHTEYQKKTCHQCIYVSSSIAESFLTDEGSSSLSGLMKVRMATYLYILSCVEAEWIYVTDRTLTVPYKALARVVDKEFDTGPVFLGPGDVFEPCHHFVDPVTWYGRNNRLGPQSQYSLKNVTRRSVYAVVNECFHAAITEDRWKMSLDQRAPIPFVMPGTFASLDFSNILLPREAMWTLIAAIPRLATENSTLDQQSLRLNMAVQRILWETRHQIGFIPAPPQRKSCSFCSVTSEMEALGKDKRRAIVDWRCNDSHPLTLCLEKLVDFFVDDVSTTSVLATWLNFLNKHPNKQTERQPLTFEKLRDKSLGRRLFLAPARLLRKQSIDNVSVSYPNNPFRSICRKSKPYKSFIPSSFQKPDVLLLIIINDDKYMKNIPMFEYLYGRYFNHIVYCSTSIGSFVEVYKDKNLKFPVSFITVHNVDNSHLCTTTAFKLNYDVIGYFQYSDDVLVNLWNYNNLPMQLPWFQSFKGVGRVTDKFFRPGNGGLRYFTIWSRARSLMRLAWEQLQTLRACPIQGRRVGLFLDTLANGTGCSTCIFFGNADIFYIPQNIAKEFTYFTDFFTNYDVHFEITIITVLGGLVPRDDIYGLSGNYIWMKEREKYARYYKEDHHFMHAWKFSNLANADGKEFFCERYVPNFDQHLRETSFKNEQNGSLMYQQEESQKAHPV